MASSMFFRREKPRQWSYSDRLEDLKKQGFSVDRASAGTLVKKYGCAAILEDTTGGTVRVGKIGIALEDEIALLVDAGYQKFFRTETGRRLPATAAHLRALHDFQEDLKEALGQISLYNESLGSISEQHMYDRVKDRDHGRPPKAWEVLPR